MIPALQGVLSNKDRDRPLHSLTRPNSSLILLPAGHRRKETPRLTDQRKRASFLKFTSVSSVCGGGGQNRWLSSPGKTATGRLKNSTHESLGTGDRVEVLLDEKDGTQWEMTITHCSRRWYGGCVTAQQQSGKWQVESRRRGTRVNRWRGL